MNLEREHLLSMTLEAKVAGLDDAGVNRSHRDLVNTGPLHLEERMSVAGARGAAPPGKLRVFAEGLEPRVTRDRHPVNLVELALERLSLSKLRRKRRKRASGGKVCAQDAETAGAVLRHDKKDVVARIVAKGGQRKERHDTPAILAHGQSRAAKAVRVDGRDIV
jgi:hypothetical protein